MPPKNFSKKPFTNYKKGVTTKKPPSINTDAKYLIIVESPSKCTKIEHFLGDDYCCIASKGHIRTIEGLNSIDTKGNFEPMFSIIEEKNNHIEFMKTIIEKFSKNNIILATDDDREGEAIAWHICKLFNLPVETTKRIIFHEITKQAICNAVKEPTTINMDIVHAQHARQVLDVIVGYKISPYLWKYLYNNKSNSLSAGRCQTPALRLVYDNEKNKNAGIEIRHKITGTFFSKNIDFTLNHEFEKQPDVLDFLEKTKSFEHKLSICSQKESIKSAPKPFNTSRLLQTANSMLHISPKDTMNICQQLYQNGFITYMRTESTLYSSTFLEKAKKYILDEWKTNDYLGNLDKLENKDSSNPHEAIRVTYIETYAIPNCDDRRMNSIYKLIWKNTLASCMSDARYNIIPIKISAPLNYNYLYEIEIPVFLGWKKVEERTSKNELTVNQTSQSALLLFFQSIQSNPKNVTYQRIESSIVVRNKHQHYTEASLINKLEEMGIGRPSTFATIVETIQERGYVLRTDLNGEKVECKEYSLCGVKIVETVKEKIFGNEKNKLVIQPIGILTIEFLLQYYQQLFSYEYTKNMEHQLDTISSGIITEWSQICKSCYNEIKELSTPIKKIQKQSYAIDDIHEFIFEKYGPSIRRKLDEGTFEYLNVKKDINIDLEKLKNKEYTLNELLELKTNLLGEYQGEKMLIKNGRYGPYVEWGNKKESIKDIKKPLSEITLIDIENFLERENTQDKNVIRPINEIMSIRKGKYGPYVYYKTPDMKKPQFLNIKKFPDGYLRCEKEVLIKWICETYNLPIQ
jgi:DNA topoisomerase-1